MRQKPQAEVKINQERERFMSRLQQLRNDIVLWENNIGFFTSKREYYAQNKENQLNNLQLKTDLCIQAEALQESSEWKKTTEDLINLQKKWKEIGPVPKKQSDAVWKRFRAACDHFFNRKSEHYQDVDQAYSQNLEAKHKLLEEVNSFVLTDNIEENFRIINEFQRRWSEIGYVPFKEKNNLQEKFRKAILGVLITIGIIGMIGAIF